MKEEPNSHVGLSHPVYRSQKQFAIWPLLQTAPFRKLKILFFWIAVTFPFLVPKRRGCIHHYLLACVLMSAALWVRLAIAPVSAGLQYLTFFPAVAIAAIIGGFGAGLLATSIGVAFATYIFVPPYYSFSTESLRFSFWSNTVFLMDGFMVSIAIETMHRYRQKYADELKVTKESEAWMRVSAVAFESQEGIMITDPDNVILRVNKAFSETTGYSGEELVGKTPRLLKSGWHDAAFYSAMWESIQQTDSWEGEIWDRRKGGEIYPKWLCIKAIKDENGKVTHYLSTQTDITDRKKSEAAINNLAFYDPLTQLPNRRLLQDRLSQALASGARSGHKGALLFIDLDNFKSLNDTLGHAKGDLLLQQTAQRLTACIREGDTVGRLGGDEFVVMLEDMCELSLGAAAQTETIGEKILVSLNQPYLLGTHVYQCSSSIGATLFGDAELKSEEIMKQADIAMYQAKKSGGNALRFFDPQMQNSINERVALERELRNALENKQFQLHFQIQVDSANRPFGAEALIRWIHPERGLVSPAQFIPLAEEVGLILPIGQWVLETACAQLKLWQQNEDTRDLILSVNVSAKQFHQADFAAQVKDVTRRYAINTDLLKLELTESMLLMNIEATISTMIELRSVGIQFSLDDFGTGYSSLQYLRRLPLSQLKIDRSFVQDIVVDRNGEAIVSTIIAMAHSLNLDVIAEGVETDEQRQILMNKGCKHYQGYLFGKPVPIEPLEALLNDYRYCFALGGRSDIRELTS